MKIADKPGNNFNSALLFKLTAAILVVLAVSLLEQKFSILFWGTIWLGLGWALCSISFHGRNRNICLSIFYLFFTVYCLYSTVCNYFYVLDPTTDYFYSQDSLHFFAYSDKLGKLHSIKEIFNFSFTDFTSANWKAFALISGIVAFIANVLDDNNIIVQKLIIVFFSSMILPYVYNILCYYFPGKRAYTLTIIYGLLTYSLFYSAILLRDIPIGFFFIVLINSFYTRQSLNKIPLFILLSFIISLFRPEHGIFSLIFLFAYLYIYLKEKRSKYKFLFTFPIILLGAIAIGNEMDFFFNTLSSTTNHYLEHSVDVAGSNSLGLVLLKLPWGLRQLAAGLFSQTLPFPFYIGLDKNGLGFITLSIAALFWFFIWFVILQLLFNSTNRRLIDSKLWILFLVASILILGASVNADTRRIISVYPIFFIISMRIYLSFNKFKRIKIVLSTTLCYVFLLGVYLFIKG